MANDTIQLTDQLYDYLISVSLRESDALRRLRAETATLERASMQMSPDTGQFLAFLIKLIGAKRVIEVGVFTGYSSLAMSLALPDDGQLIACDVSDEWTAIGRRYWQEAGVNHKIDLRLAPAVQTLQQLIDEGHQNSFDFIFIDADKPNYDTYYEQAYNLVRSGGLICIDNVLWHGRVLDESRQDEGTQAIRVLNKKLYTDERVDLSLVPIGDGVTILRKR
ncbi:MAG TPA: class I SAM-dependent methyltransferase [Anaerolineae bacterium]